MFRKKARKWLEDNGHDHDVRLALQALFGVMSAYCRLKDERSAGRNVQDLSGERLKKLSARCWEFRAKRKKINLRAYGFEHPIEPVFVVCEIENKKHDKADQAIISAVDSLAKNAVNERGLSDDREKQFVVDGSGVQEGRPP